MGWDAARVGNLGEKAMSSITSLLTNLLNDYKKSAGTDTSALTTDQAAAATSTTATDSTHGSAYVVDLSQAAQDILSSKGSSSVISLTDAQKQKLDAILEKYKDQPINADTLANLSADLQKAGLAPDELATIQEAKDFNHLVTSKAVTRHLHKKTCHRKAKEKQ